MNHMLSGLLFSIAEVRESEDDSKVLFESGANVAFKLPRDDSQSSCVIVTHAHR